MLKKPDTTTVPPPQLISALRTGFDVVATHIYLIVIPIFIDLFIWLGPHFSLKTLLQPLISEVDRLPGMDAPEMATLLKYSQDLWQTIAEQLNLAGVLRTYPIGVPSLMASQLPQVTPVGNPTTVTLGTLSSALVWWVIFILVGLVAGSLYFDAIARTLSKEKKNQSVGRALRLAGQAVLLSIAWIILFIAISLPATLLLTILAMISPAIAQIGLLIFSVMLVWIVVPLLFSPHGIFIYNQNVLTSMLTSVRLVRFTLPGTGLFFLAVIVLSQGLDLLWQVPPSNSWLSLVGIGGHAFVTTSLLAASFAFYRDGVQWVKDYLQHSVTPHSKLSKI